MLSVPSGGSAGGDRDHRTDQAPTIRCRRQRVLLWFRSATAPQCRRQSLLDGCRRCRFPVDLLIGADIRALRSPSGDVDFDAAVLDSRWDDHKGRHVDVIDAGLALERDGICQFDAQRPPARNFAGISGTERSFDPSGSAPKS